MFTDVDVLLTPATPAPAPRDLSTTGDARFQSPWTYAGVPTIALPSGFSQGGMPLGLQLIAPALQEERLLRAARWCEAALDFTLVHRCRPAPYSGGRPYEFCSGWCAYH